MFDLGAIIRVWRRSVIVAWSTLLRSTNNLAVNAMHGGGKVLVSELGCTVADDDIAIGSVADRCLLSRVIQDILLEREQY
jgi:hypothetical protein